MLQIRTSVVSALAVCFALGTVATHAQVAPVKPGLWQIQVERETNGQKAPDMSERLKNMPPERRAEIEAMMKQRGIDTSGNITKVCQTREMLDSKQFVNSVPDCKTTYSTRTDSSWKSHTSCPANHLESDGEVIFSNSENYLVKTSSTIQSGGQTKISHMTTTAKWLSSDCGDIKPLSTNP